MAYRRTEGGTTKTDQRDQGKDKKTYGKHKEPENDAKKGRISDNSPCPVHPGQGHTWGKCYHNVNNSESPILAKR